MSPALALLWVVVGIALLVIMNLKYKVHNIFALLIAGLFVAIMEGVPLDKIVSMVQQGLGGIMGHLALIIIFGAIIGKFMTESGASQQIADTVIRRCGTRYLAVGLMFIGVIFGIAMFYEVAFFDCHAAGSQHRQQSQYPVDETGYTDGRRRHHGP